MPGTTVAVRNEGTGLAKTVVADDAGRYKVLDLLSGRYTVEAHKEGFKTYLKTGIELVTSTRLAVNIPLEIGQVTDTVEVTATAAQVNTLSAQVEKVVEERKFRELPLNGRNITSILTIKAGISSRIAPNSFRPTSDPRTFYFTGSRAEDAYFSTDGVAMTGGRNNLRGPSTIGLESIAEAIVVTNSYSAEYPRAGGGQVQFITKSGIRDFHGSAYEFLRNDNLDAG